MVPLQVRWAPFIGWILTCLSIHAKCVVIWLYIHFASQGRYCIKPITAKMLENAPYSEVLGVGTYEFGEVGTIQL